MSVATYTGAGTKATTPAKLDKKVFGEKPTDFTLLKNAYEAYLANGRANLAVAKTRGEIRGGGKKPWRQKGLGRARAGSIRSPIWRGGGITFGPTGQENYRRKIHTTAKRQAIRQALSLKATSDAIKIIETFESKDGTVKPVLKLLDKVGAKGNILVAVEAKSEQIERATRNLQDVKVVQANYLNVYNILNADTILISQKALGMIHEWLGGKS